MVVGAASEASTWQGTARTLFVDGAVYLDYSAATACIAALSVHLTTSCALIVLTVSIRAGASAGVRRPTHAEPGRSQIGLARWEQA